jgi:hypothetical protein
MVFFRICEESKAAGDCRTPKRSRDSLVQQSFHNFSGTRPESGTSKLALKTLHKMMSFFR